MALITSFDSNFEITSLSFTPNIITIGEETSYTITIKNVSGKKISSMRMEMDLFYKDANGKVHASVSSDVYSGTLEYGFKSISWSSGSSKTFTGKFIFTPLSYYPAKIDARLLPTYLGSEYGYTGDNLKNERLGLRLSITSNVIFGDYFNNSDYFFDIRGENSEYMYVIDARYRPTISMFSAERSIGNKVNDEGENLLSDIKLNTSAAAKLQYLSMNLSYRDHAEPDSDPMSVDLTSEVSAALASETQVVVDKTFGKNSDWDLVLWFGDRYESTVMSISVARSFANVHLSGASTGGVCFGSFSKATEENPLFQCYYPAEFEAGIRGGLTYEAEEVNTGGRWIDGKLIYRRIVQGSVSTSSGTASTTEIVEIPGLETVINMYGTVNRSGACFPLTMFAGTSNHHRVSCTDGLVKFTSTHSASASITIEYTKTTEEVIT